MKAFLLYADRDLDPKEAPANEPDLTADLELETLLGGMSRGDSVLHRVARAVLLCSVTTSDEILYRQAILADWLRQPAVLAELYDLALAAIAAERSVWRAFHTDLPESLLHRSVNVLELLAPLLVRLRRSAEEHAGSFSSAGLTRFFGMLTAELDEDYVRVVEHHLKELRFRRGLLMSARLGQDSQGIGYVLRTPPSEHRGLLRRPSLKKPSYSFTIPDRDESGFRSLSELRERGLNVVANAAAQSAEHVLNFFVALRDELAFYVGCLNLREQLLDKGGPLCFPEPRDAEERRLAARGLYEPSLSLRLAERATGSDVAADGKALVVVTGANQGGKSTFLRSVGVAQLMMQCGMFVCAEYFSASVCSGVFTHYRREEDEEMVSGKLDEELARMSDIADHVAAGGLLLCNESFAATNEREGSEIARAVIRAMVDADVRVCLVTHLFDLANGFYAEHSDAHLFLRAPRQRDGHPMFELTEGAPLPTSYGEDLFRNIFGAERTNRR